MLHYAPVHNVSVSHLSIFLGPLILALNTGATSHTVFHVTSTTDFHRQHKVLRVCSIMHGVNE
jgi:hypothetical protein